MAKKYPSELNTKQVRVSLGDYALLREISLRAGVTMAEALHLALERQEQVTRVSSSQTRLPIFQVAPAASVIAVNGNRHVAIVEAGRPQPHTPLYDALLRAAAALERAADSFDIYNLIRKRLQKEIKKEMVRIEGLLQELQGIPITQEQKIAAKVSKKMGR